jgi:hypothetical protein
LPVCQPVSHRGIDAFLHRRFSVSLAKDYGGEEILTSIGHGDFLAGRKDKKPKQTNHWANKKVTVRRLTPYYLCFFIPHYSTNGKKTLTITK